MSEQRVDLIDGPGEDPSKPLENAAVEQDGDTTRVQVQPKQAEDPAPKDPPSDPPAEPKQAEEGPKGGVEGAVKDAGLDLNDLAKEWQEEGGKLTDETYEALAKAGITKDMVDAYAKGQEALAAQWTATLEEHVGGKEKLTEVLEWAGENLTPQEKAVANYALASMDAAAAKLVLNGILAQHEAAVGSSPKFVTGEAAPTSAAIQPFGSAAEMSRAMRDPKYASDPAYRDQVYKRLAISKF